uniref:non-specific serine/threonine protein kinase n=1 Tax=Leersia perrieri TaxID=77586 RepID=A0A0D9XPE7_9ORYZ
MHIQFMCLSRSMHSTRNTLIILLTIIGTASFFRGGGACVPSERAALLAFKKGITSDPAKFLSSWSGWDCCRWRGVVCSNRTGHVLKLHLGNPDPDIDFDTGYSTSYENALSGEISPSLLSLGYLEYLDLSMNYWGGETSPMPLFLGSMKNLRYLNLSGIHFSGSVPPQYGNLSKLQYLDLGNTVESADLTLFRNLPMLQYLGMSQIHLSSIADWPQKLNMIPSTDQSLPHLNLTKLEKLDLSGNDFNHSIASCWFWKATTLKYLKLSSTSLFGQLNDAPENMTSLQVLDLSCFPFTQVVDLEHDGHYYQPDSRENNLYTLQMVGNFKNLCSLQILDLSDSYKSGDLTMLLESLPQCAWGKLRGLHLSCNNFTGTLPNLIEHFTSLRTLELNDNKLSGRIPPGIGKCTRLSTLHIYNNHLNGSVPTEIGVLAYLTSLDVSNNQLSGVITEEHFKGLTGLRTLDLSYNNNLRVIVEGGWLPPFRLEYGVFASCQIGPLFPAWLRQQLSISHLDFSSTGMKDKIPEWFWSTVSQATYLDISDNELTGSLPAHLDDMAFTRLNLSSNHLTGPVPPFPRNIKTLDISSNSFSGILPLSEAPELSILLMFSNQISGRIPESMCNMTLIDLDLSSNILEGEIPQCFANLELGFLLLSNNSLTGMFPTVLGNNTRLKMLDLSWNQFFGQLPTWIGERKCLSFLRLGHNMFSGNIPLEIGYLTSLQFLDLSSNNLSGVIPQHLANLSGMTTLTADQRGIFGYHTTNRWGNKVLDVIDEDQFDELLLIIIKGQQLKYGKGLDYFVSIDLSDNSLSGEIPIDITSLDALINLNLSSNHLRGKIPNKIGAMKSLESLDLSKNKLSGEIPSSLSNLTSLSYMNLSYNNLTGRIPSGRQLDTLNADNPSLMYIGNNGLCGPPLQKKCSGNGSFIHGNGTSYYRNELEPLSFYLGLVVGVVVGLWMVFCALLFKKTWRIAYFRLFDKFYDTVYLSIVLKWASLTRNASVE